MKTILVMDTSTEVMSLALLSDDRLLVESNETVDRRHSDKLLPAIQTLINTAGMTMQDIEGIVVGQGPGSYTGVRIGVTAAKTLAWTLGVPLLGVSSMEALANGAFEAHKTAWQEGRGTWVVPLTDARRGRVYTAIYKGASQSWQSVAADQVRPIADWLIQIKENYAQLALSDRPKHIIFVGEIEAFEDLIRQAFGDDDIGQVHCLKQEMRAHALGKLAQQQRWSDTTHEDIHRLVPNYTQLAEAEANLLAKRK